MARRLAHRPTGRMTPCRDPVPQHCPTPRELDDLELLFTGALAPLTALQRARQPGHAEPARRAGRRRRGRAGRPRGPAAGPGLAADGGAVEPLTHAQYGPFRRLHLTPAQAREQYAGAHVRPGRRRRSPRPDSTELRDARPRRAARAGRHRHPGALPGRRWSAPPSPRPTCSTTPTSSPSRSPPTATPTPTTRSGVQVVANYAGPDPVRGPRRAARGRPAPTRPQVAADRRPRPAAAPTSRASCSSSPASPAAASPRSPAP